MKDVVEESVDAPAGIEPPRSLAVRIGEIIASFGKLGLTSFGGPVAHIGYYRAEFVEKRRWLDDHAFADLVALCQFLPGPASSQIVFALGMQRAGVLGALVASTFFILPSALVMIAFAYGVTAIGDLAKAGWLHGLKLAAVAVVAQAVWNMGRKLCPDRPRVTLCVCAAAALLTFPGALVQLGIIMVGAMLGWLLYRSEIDSNAPLAKAGQATRHLTAGTALLIFFVLLIALPVMVAATESGPLTVFESFYRSGSLVFGGGHVVLPLLREGVVGNNWVTDDQFLAGYGAAQAVPGPLFTFSAYLGTVMKSGPGGWINGVWCLFALFLPGWLLIGGTLPFWHRLRSSHWAQAALRGANAAVVGILLAALYDPVFTGGVRSAPDVAAAVVAFCALQLWKAPSWLIVLVMAGVGQWLLPLLTHN